VPENLTASQVDKLKRAAKKLAREEGIPHSRALDRLASERGYKNWSLLQKHAVPNPIPLHRTTYTPVMEYDYMSDITQAQVQVLDAFEARTDTWTFGDFDNAIEEAMGPVYGNYQTAKLVIILADRLGRWPKTVEGWIRSNFKAFGNLPAEMIAIGRKFDLTR